MFPWSRQSRRARLLAQPYPAEWETWPLANVAHDGLLSEDERAWLREDTRIFVAEKHWEGCRGLQVTEEMKVTVAAQSCLMLLGIEHDYFSRVLTVLLYPTAFALPSEDGDEGEEREAVAGQAFYHSPVILSWDSVLAEGRDPAAGDNLVIHEFAHQLDFLDGSINGTPELFSPELADRWYEAMTAEYHRQVRHVRKGRETFLGDYAARNEAEFFARASERFFTVPARLQHYHREVYEVLAEFYGVEPIEWFARAGNGASDPTGQKEKQARDPVLLW
jgi:Mlc titration factor MtfA (ptsG expression regulator)